MAAVTEKRAVGIPAPRVEGERPKGAATAIQSDDGSGPYHSMSIGETAIMPTAAAIANAVEDAVGVRIKSLPITAEKVLEALKKH
jgi:CO/xanthine dehydrogenase Mo-binding subunit